MRTNLLVTPLIASAALVLLSAGPAMAAEGDTDATFEILAGALEISAPASVDLGTKPATAAGGVLTQELGAVTVTDGRGVALGWVASASSTDFAGPGGGVPASAVDYASAPSTTVGNVDVTSTDVSGLDTPKAVETTVLAVGANSATWVPTLTVNVPAGALSGTYTATVTHSVL